jgi:YHS domain-containing protein
MKNDKEEPTFKDPVCEMVLSRKTAVAEAEYQGKTYYFCAEICRDAFEADPEKYLRGRGRS